MGLTAAALALHPSRFRDRFCPVNPLAQTSEFARKAGKLSANCLELSPETVLSVAHGLTPKSRKKGART
jgi:hypothetical protein